MGRIGAPKAAYAMIMFPVVALILSALFEGLVLEPHILIGVTLALTGNIAILARARIAAVTRERAKEKQSVPVPRMD